MPSIATVSLTIIVLALGILYQIRIAPFLALGGFYRTIEPLNTDQCTSVEELKACEKFVIHSSGLVYLACAASLESRLAWMPTLDHLNSTAFRAQTSKDYVAIYDPSSHKVTKLNAVGLPDPRGLSVHGMDVVADEHNSDLLWVYLVNHRPPLDPSVNAHDVGADSVVEVFKTHLGTNFMEWVKTVADPEIIVTPNDIVGGTNGKEFWFTNDHETKIGLKRMLQVLLFRSKSTSVGYCHVNTGCKIAADELYASNGIVRTHDGKIWVASCHGGYVTVHEQQADKTLVPIEVIQVGAFLDNLSVSPDGSVIAATFPNVFATSLKSFKNNSLTAPTSAHRISINTGHGSYFGEKYKVQKIYEDNGDLGSSATSAALYKDMLYLHGLMAHRLQICKIPLKMLE